MKKTLITLLALAGIAAGETPITLTGDFANKATKSEGRGTLTWNENVESSITSTLTSWQVSFDITPNLRANKDRHNGTYQYSFFSTDNDSSGTVKGLGLYSKTWGKLEVKDVSGNKTYSPSTDDAINPQCLNNNGTKKSLTITFIANVDQNGDYQGGTFTVTSKDGATTYLTANMDSTVENTALVSGSAAFRTFSADTNCNAIYTIGNVAVSMLDDNIVESVPEPTTATLSLLALCGLAARRRRH